MANLYPKFVKTFFIALLLIGSGYLSAQNKYWLEQAGSATPDEAYSISIDDSNNTYTTGYFSGNASFGSAIALSTFAVSDIFITKTNSLGIYKWAVKAGDGGADRGLAIKTDKNGNSYVTGYYYSTATFGSQNITSAGLQDVFVAKYDRNGNLKWVVSAGGPESDIGNAITLDNTGNVIITGQFTGTATFGTYTLTSTNNNINVFTAKLDSSNGNFLWAKSGTGPHTDRGLGVACDPTGNVYITGQFTDTITFDNVHFSPLYNAIFIVKYDNNGNEQWITTAGGGIYNIANAIAVDNSSNVYITGNFQGNLDFFVNPIVTLTNTYFNRIFIAKYDQNANLLWDVADGSSNPLTANNISLDPAGNPYIIGNFECVLNGYADRYGQGTFNTVGYWDVFTAGYAGTDGSWIWSRQIGGHGNNYGNGIAIDTTAHLYTAGSFDDDMIVPMDTNFVDCNSSYDFSYCRFEGCNHSYCSDNYYGHFGTMTTFGNLDIFIAKPIDLTRQTYDYYSRYENFCDRPQVGVCINDNNSSIHGGCQDTVRFCEYNFPPGIALFANTQTCNNLNDIGPDFNFLWSTHATGNQILINSPGWYYVTATSVDGCFTSRDSILVIAEPVPKTPWISDNVIVETDDTNAYNIILCGRDCILTGGNYGTNTYTWYVPGPNGPYDSISTTATSSGDYTFLVTNSYGCVNANTVHVTISDSLPRIIPKLVCSTCHHDSAFFCIGDGFIMLPYDSITNPGASLGGCIPPEPDTHIEWAATPSATITYPSKSSCASLSRDWDPFSPSDSGWYNITATIIRRNTCDTAINILSDSVYVRLYPLPNLTITITGNHYVCPGDKTWLVAHGGTNYSWSQGSTTDSIYVGATPPPYQVTSRDTNSYGCTAFATASFGVHTVPQPKIDMNPTNGIVCPNDSVELNCSSADGSFTWNGPYGPIAINSPHIYVKIPGYYSCVRTDSLGCVQLSNTVEVGLYATPYLVVTPSYTICPGDSAKLTAIASNGATYNWLPPLNGTDSVQYVNVSGTYSCEVVSCGITTIASATILLANPNATITAAPSTSICPNGKDTVVLSGAPGMAQYVWTPGNIINPTDTITQPGTYSLAVTDGYGCTASSSITITAPTQISISSLTHINPLCFDDTNASITITISGGIPAYIYNWSNGATTSTITGLSVGTYSVLVNDKCGSSVSASVTITQPTAVRDSVVSFSNILCNGNNSGNISIGVTGGSPSYAYTWSNGASTVAISGLSAGTYTVSVTDKNGCAATASATLTQPTALAYSNISNTNESCNGGANANASVTISGGTPSYTYLWNPTGKSTPTVSNLSAGSYSVIVTDSLGCTLTTSVVITQPLAISTTISSDSATCINNNGGITVSVGGGNSPYSYSWSPGGSTNFSVSSLSAGKYTVTITDANGCIDTASGIVAINKTFTMTVTGTDSVCKGQSVTLTAMGAATYKWSNSNTSSSITVSPTTNTTYWVIGSLGVCNDSIPYAVSVYKNLSSNMPLSDTICAGKPVILKVNVAGGKPAYTYVWNNGITNATAGPITVYPTATTTYSVTVTDACNYISTDTMHVVVVPSGNASFYVSPDTIQPGQVVTFTNTGTGNTSYYWTFGDGSSTTGTSPTHDYANSGTYQIMLIGYNSYGCPDTATGDVFVSPMVIIPNVFTPNGDGQNDVFYFTIAGATCLHCNIYNRWGVLVYQLNSVAEGWPGIIRQTNEPASDGVYYYILDYCDYTGKTHKLDGFIQLIRNK